MDLRKQFIDFYTSVLCHHELWKDMGATVENSPWHREANVRIHTNMVVDQYLKRTKDAEWTINTLIGALACAFHDVGKPGAMEWQYNDDRGFYARFGGHELLSARLAEDFLVSHWSTMEKEFGLQPKHIHSIGYLIEHHLPYNIVKADKKHNVIRTLFERFNLAGLDVFSNMLISDNYGRISDDHDQKKADTLNWISAFSDTFCETVANGFDEPNTDKNVFVLIGASGSGKSTFCNSAGQLEDARYHSLDGLRLNFYGKENLDWMADEKEVYSFCFKRSTEDKEFSNKAQQHYLSLLKDPATKDVIVDNTNISAKRRKFYVDEAKRKGFRTVGVMFPVDIKTLHARHQSRPDKYVPWEAVKDHYMNLQYPSYGEFDAIYVVHSNLK